ncbi:MAG: 2'-5' RNA ligase family protein [Aeromicrobium sp.]
MGVAIAIPEPFGSELRQKRADFGDPMAETVPSHVTLMPPTALTNTELDGVCDALQSAASGLHPFPMRLRGTGTFRPISPVVFIAVSQGISYTEILAKAVRTKLGSPELKFPFHPHVTVAHNLDDDALDRAYDELAAFECAFQVESIHLYLHENEDGWTPRHEFLLGPDM